MDWKKAGVFAATFALGGAAYAIATSGLGRRACVNLVGKGIKLKECVAYSIESIKEGVEDIVAEAKELDGPSVCTCAINEGEESDS
jgi:hypothetical protein